MALIKILNNCISLLRRSLTSQPAIEFGRQRQRLEVEICVAPVLVCREARKTAGAGDNISASGLAAQL